MKKIPSHIRLCAWCKRIVIEGTGASRKEIPVATYGYTVAEFGKAGSHGICSVCSVPLMLEAKQVKGRSVKQARSNPPSWATDKKKWRDAVFTVIETYGNKKPEDFYAVVSDVYKKMGGGIKRKVRGNPSDAEWQKALDLFSDFHEFLPDAVTVASIPRKSMPSLVVQVGELVELTYRSNKWDRNSISVDYTHKFKKPLPVLVSDADGNLYIVGGSYKITADGIVG
jgi:hypothetical protein